MNVYRAGRPCSGIASEAAADGLVMNLQTFLHTLAPKCQASTSGLGKVVGFESWGQRWFIRPFSAVAPPLLA
jgi:hypothetical protein